MARSAQRRNRQRSERRPTPRATTPISRQPATYEDTMFFPRLRRQAKWMFVFLAVIFGLGYVIFNVGGTIPGTGLGDILSGLGQGSSGPSASDARNKIEDHPNDPAGYQELATSLQRDGKSDEAIEPLSRYVQLKKNDRAALSNLAGLYLTKGRRLQDEAIRVQNQLIQLTGGDLFTPGQSSKFGQQFGQGEITQIESNRLNQQLSEKSIAAQDAYRNAQRVYGDLVRVTTSAQQAEQPSLFLQQAFAAQSAGDYKTAIKAYKRFLVLSPASPNAAGVKQQIAQLRAALKAQPNQG
jgi:tetratricopeptide (TPR) repeat protein